MTFMNVARITFSGAEIIGCYFHLCQSLITKANTVGLRTAFEANVNIKLQVKFVAVRIVLRNLPQHV